MDRFGESRIVVAAKERVAAFKDQRKRLKAEIDDQERLVEMILRIGRRVPVVRGQILSTLSCL